MAASSLIGKAQYRPEDYDLMTIVMLCLGDKPYTELEDGVFQLLQVMLLESEMPAVEKFRALEKKFNIKLPAQLRKGVAMMCNLSEGVFRRGEARGFKRGETKRYAQLIRNGIITE